MQYILTQEEFDAWNQKSKQITLTAKKNMQELCTKIANTMPITWSWGVGKNTPTPCGCIHSEEDWYCDECPVREICPEPNKAWSK